MINFLLKHYGLIGSIGYSDHTLGIEAARIARAMGCTVFEKHVTPDVNMPGLDHSYSFPIDKFEVYVNAIKGVDEIIGNDKKIILENEIGPRDMMKRGLWFKRSMDTGQEIIRDDIIVRRPLKGAVNQVSYFNILGKKVKKSVKENDPVIMENLYE